MDIVERLRKPVIDDMFFAKIEPIKCEAADEIEKLREERNRLRKQNQNQALDFIASEGEWCEMTDKKNKEIERLREVLRRIANDKDGLDVWSFAEAALKEKE